MLVYWPVWLDYWIDILKDLLLIPTNLVQFPRLGNFAPKKLVAQVSQTVEMWVINYFLAHYFLLIGYLVQLWTHSLRERARAEVKSTNIRLLPISPSKRRVSFQLELNFPARGKKKANSQLVPRTAAITHIFIYR